VWVDRSHRAPAYVDVNIVSIAQLPGMLARLTPLR
jgi:hypothetical protein